LVARGDRSTMLVWPDSVASERNAADDFVDHCLAHVYLAGARSHQSVQPLSGASA